MSLPRMRPSSVDELSAMLREATAAERGLRVRGGGTRLGVANAPDRSQASLDLRDLRGVIELDAEEGVVNVAAGTALSLVAAEARAAGFELPLDPPGEGSTVGGCLAAAAHGPRFASPRDAVLGLGVVLATGEVTRCGGRVVKNVTGYDLMKLHVGAFGSLGVIASAWLRLRPAPERTLVLAAKDETIPRALAASRLASARAVALQEGALVVELAGDAPAVLADRRRLADLEEWDGSALDAARAAQQEPARVRVRVASLASRLVDACVPLREAGARVLVYPASGLVFASFDDERGVLEATRGASEIGGGPYRLEHASPTLREREEVFGAVEAELPLHRRLKQRFDPAGILNPGCFVGSL